MRGAKNEEYEKVLEEAYEEIIRPENKCNLKAMLIHYDSLLKQKYGIGKENIPCWHYGWWRGRLGMFYKSREAFEAVQFNGENSYEIMEFLENDDYETASGKVVLEGDLVPYVSLKGENFYCVLFTGDYLIKNKRGRAIVATKDVFESLFVRKEVEV